MNINAFSVKVAGFSILVLGAAVVVLIGHSQGPKAPHVEPPPSGATPVVHTADWYVAHPEVLKEDEKKCAGDASEISAAACQNASSADARLSAIEMQKAAQESAPSESTTTPAKSSP